VLLESGRIKKAAQKMFGEIDTRSPIHQHFSCAFCADIWVSLYWQKKQAENVDEFDTRGQFQQHSINSFYAPRSWMHKKESQQCHLALLGPTSVKAAHKMLVKMTPGLNFINILLTAFTPADPRSVKKTVKSSVSFYAFGIYEHKSCT